MVEKQLRSLGLRFPAAAPPPSPDQIRHPIGRPPVARPGWEEFLVAQKRASDAWPAEAAGRITAARRCYDAGTHEMVSLTTREGWTQLYCRPRRVPAGARSFFASVGAA